jgi:Transposase, Mutator family
MRSWIGPSKATGPICGSTLLMPKVRQNGRIVSVAAVIAVGVNNDGRREMLGMDIGRSEAETFRAESLASCGAWAARRQAGGLECS